MTNAQKVALTAARRAVQGMTDEPQQIVSGSIRETGAGFEIRLETVSAVYLVKTSAAGEVETIEQPKVH